MKINNTISGKFIKRYKRFFADVELANGDIVTAHCPNSGAMSGVLIPGAPAIITYHDNPNRTLPYTWQMVQIDNTWIGINTHNTNNIVDEALNDQSIEPLKEYSTIKREVKYGQNSRIDFFLSNHSTLPDCYVEVKNVHLKRDEGAYFPDSVTARGSKHLQELISMKQQGFRCVVLYIIQRSDCTFFSYAKDIDPVYGKNAHLAKDAGVESYAYFCNVTPSEITVQGQMDIR